MRLVQRLRAWMLSLRGVDLGGWLWVTRTSGARLSVRNALMSIVVQTTGIALLLSGAALLTNDLATYRRARASDLATEASILALASAPALAFDDHTAAVDNLAALRVHPAVRAAGLYSADGRLYAQFVRAGVHALPPTLSMATATRVGASQIQLAHRIVQNGEWLGTLYLRADYRVTGVLLADLEIVLLVTAASFIIALLLSNRMQRVITRPLNAVSRVAAAVVNRHDYAQRVSETAPDEIGLLVKAFNGMMDEVQSRTRELEQADRSKDEFLAMLAHELRNPLAPIRNAAELLKSPAASEKQRRWASEVIARQTQHMGLLLDDLLDVSRITRGRLELKKVRVELASVVATAIETSRPLITSKEHSLQVSLPYETIEVQVDPLRVSQIIANLLNNAAKYMDPRGLIKLAVCAEAHELRISVEDAGVGFEPSALPKLFKMFSQIESPIDRAEGGLGIGLALVKGLITLHGGTVEAMSPGPGQGSTFTLRLPASCIVSLERRPTQAATAPETRSHAIKILIADDNRDAADSLAHLLRMQGHQLVVAYSGAAALELAERERPAAFVLDIGMPGMDGYELARRIRNEPWGKHAFLFALSGWGQSEDIARAKDAGFDAHLTKPVDPSEVQRLLTDRIDGECASAKSVEVSGALDTSP